MLNIITKSAAATILAAALLSATSCQKDSIITKTPVDPTTPATAGQLLKVEQDANNSSSFEYNADLLVSKVTTKQGGNSISTAVTYNGDKTVATANYNGVTLNYIYSGGSLTKVEYRAAGNILGYYTEFVNTNGKVSEQRGFGYDQGNASPDYKIQYTYNAAGDVQTEKQLLWDSNVSNYVAGETSVYEYDSYKNPLVKMTGIAFMLFNTTAAHNITKETVTDAQNKLVATRVYTYTYNEAGYPLTSIEKTTARDNPNVVTKQQTFIYKN